MGDMFCFQCQQTAHNTGCEGSAGVCGKKADTANYQDDLVSALIGLARAVRKKGATEKSDELMLKGLFTTITNVNFYNDTICALIDEVNKEKEAIAPQTDNYDVQTIWDGDEDIRSLKSLILFGLKGMSAYAYHSYALGYTDPEVQAFFYAHHFSLYLLIRLFSEIGYSVGTSDDNASWRTSDGVLQPYLSCGRSSL